MTKEEILKAVKDRKTYVTLSSYINNVNLFSTVEFTQKEWEKKVDTTKAVEFLESLVPENSEEVVKFDINLGFIVNSKIRKDNKINIDSLKEDDILKDIVTVTIGCFDDKKVYRKRTFVVNLNSFIERLHQNNWHLQFSNTSGIYMYPENIDNIDLDLIKFSTLKAYRFDSINKTNGQKRSFESFIGFFYPSLLFFIDIFKDDTQLSVASLEELINTSTKEKSNVYESSTIYKVLKVLGMLGIQLENLIPESIDSAISQLSERKDEYTTQSCLEDSLVMSIEDFHEGDPAEPELYLLAKLFYTVTSDLEEIISKKHIPANFQDDIALFQKELYKQNKENPSSPHVLAANAFNSQFLTPYLQFLSSHFETDKDIKEYLKNPEDMEDICEYLISYLKNILIFLKEIDESNDLDNVFLQLASTLFFSINQTLDKGTNSLELHPVEN